MAIRVNIKLKPKSINLDQFKNLGNIGDCCKVIKGSSDVGAILIIIQDTLSSERRLLELSPQSWRIWGNYLKDYECETVNIMDVEIS